MSTDEDNLKNVGYGILKLLYKELELDKFWNRKSKGRSFQYSPDQIFRLLTFGRVLYPDSKKGTYEERGIFYEQFDDFSLDDIYNCLDFIAETKDALEKWIFDYSRKIAERDVSVSYFDCTNYYFDIGRSDMDELNADGLPVDKNGNITAPKYRKRGPEKNHRPDPIVEMGLLMDRNGIPIAYDLFPGNESEKIHMRPIIKRFKTTYADARVVFVADRGLNTSDNIYYLNGDNKGDDNQRDGYVYGQSVRGADKEFKDWVLSGNYINTQIDDMDGEGKILFRHKSRITPRTLHVNVTVPGSKKKKKKTVVVDQKQMVYYSEKYAKKQRADRQVMVQRAMDLIKHPKKYDRITQAGSAAYVIGISFDKETGEIVDGKELELDLAKIEEEAKYDGYYSIVTSELDMSDEKMREVYRGLARIEETFKISKSEFSSRPVFVRTNPHIEAHFATCFLALVLIRLLQIKLERQFPIEQVLDSLRKYCCVQVDANRFQFVYYDKILKKCSEVFELELDRKYRTRNEMRRLLKY
ncbi:MAG: IS1634 family transposase, partial [bacterium]